MVPTPIIEDISCSGPCRKRFRPDNTGLNEATANVLLTKSSDESGLFWLCRECRPTTTQREQVVLQRRRRPEQPDEFYLPPELWLMVFQNLDERSLLRVRLTCRRWKDIVDRNQSLRAGFFVEFEQMTMDEGYVPQNLFPASRASLDLIKIIALDSWWPSFGAGLTSLELWSCEISLPFLVGMLRETPNLTKLILEAVPNSLIEESVNVDFRLDKLQFLSCETVHDVFGLIFPRVTELRMVFSINESMSLKVCRFIESIQGTLKSLTCHLSPEMAEQMAHMNQLQLSFFYNVFENDDSLVKLSQIQPSLEKLTVTCSEAVLCEMAPNLIKLKHIDVNINMADEVITFSLSFLAKMPQLTYLTLAGNYRNRHRIDFGVELKSFNLHTLQLESVHLDRTLQNCPIVRYLELLSCSIQCWSNLFNVRWPLRRLKMSYIFALNFNPNIYIPHCIPLLTDLELTSCNMSSELLTQLIHRCPLIERLKFNVMDTVTDKIVFSLDRLPLLKKLAIFNCPITDAFVGVMIIRNPSVELNIRSCEKVSDVAKKRLEEMKRK